MKIIPQFLVSIPILREVLTQDDPKISVQLMRYILIGGCAFLVDIALLYVITEYLGVNYLVSAAISFCAGMAITYVFSIRWIFKKRRFANTHAEWVIFAWIGIVGLGLNEIIIWLITSQLLAHYLVSKIVASVLVLFWNFFARKYALF